MTGMRTMESSKAMISVGTITTVIASTMVVAAIIILQFSDAYLVIPQQQYHHHHQVAPASSTLFAKATKNKKKTTNKKSSSASSSGGGFGAVVKETKASSFNPITNDNSNNYDVFPPLDDAVKSTLIPSEDVHKVYDANITPDIYGRLDQIYGFPQFNYPPRSISSDDDESQSEVNEPAGSFLEDMLSSSASSPSSLLSSNGDALDDIIASVTGCSSSSASGSTSSGSKSSSSTSLERHISKLPEFDQFRILHVDPMVLAIDNFFTEEECDKYVETCTTSTQTKSSSNSDTLPPLEIKQSLTVGHDKKSKAQRTSTTWFHHYQNVPELLSKACRLLGISSGIEQFEEPQTVR